MGAKPPDTEALKILDNLLQTTTSLLRQLQLVVSEIHRPTASSASGPSPVSSSTPSIDTIALARDSTSLIRAHATKISLLIINPPFTPSALTSVVRDLIAPNGAIPGLAGAVQSCDASIYTEAFRRELAWKAKRVLNEVEGLVGKVPRDGKSRKPESEGFGGSTGRGSVASTGVLWSACDDLTKLVEGGVAGFFVDKVQEWKDTLQDVLEEMKDWSEEEPDDDEDEDDSEQDQDEEVNGLASQVGQTHLDAQDMLDDMMNAHRTIPLSDPQKIRPRLDSSIKRLRLVILLYQAVSKRRIKTLPPFSSSSSTSPSSSGSPSNVVSRLDEVTKVLSSLPSRFNDLQCAFYELNSEEIDQLMDQCFFDAFAVGEMLREGWEGEKDGFSEWVGKFQLEIKKA